MSFDLPEPLPRYFAAQNALDAESMTACFAPDAVVHDEGGIGSEAIRGWKHDTIAKYGISIDPLEATKQDDQTVVVAQVAGNFPGSPREPHLRLQTLAGRADTNPRHQLTPRFGAQFRLF